MGPEAEWCPGVVRGNRTARLRLVRPETEWCPKVVRGNRTGGYRQLERGQSKNVLVGLECIHWTGEVYVTGGGYIDESTIVHAT